MGEELFKSVTKGLYCWFFYKDDALSSWLVSSGWLVLCSVQRVLSCLLAFNPVWERRVVVGVRSENDQ